MKLFETKDLVIFQNYDLENGISYKKALVIEKNKRMHVMLEIIELIFDDQNKARLEVLERQLINKGFAVRGANLDGLTENNLIICGNEFRLPNTFEGINIKKVGVFNNDYKFNIIINKYFTFKNDQFNEKILKQVIDENRHLIKKIEGFED
ncbi:hypothetical protein [Spiroplasma endosymbiont of Aspidapion aeneum]|uniref:hypothetical protein n=1 Tax=Spiroplasma endosymbiont of Aspidapion aeneum TaxID=3066276 RepID=UPI00313CFC01